jgi:ferric-dicitrate binding protein FerR (iron transport regulator)
MTEGESRSLEVITPKGGTYSIILQDGTKVWLNADSKLEFLSNYRNKLQRIVKLTGEAYFEVAKILSPTGRDGRRPERVPFLVESNGQRVEVLGTHFNISAYKGETIKTTLLEGSVRVASLAPLGRGAAGGEGSVTLRPNQQSTVHLSPLGRDGEAREGNITVKQVDATEAITWKNGKFSFEREEMLSIMRKVARWYNVDVVFQEPLQQVKLTGSISRFENVSKLLDMLENTKEVHFKVEGRTVYVTK